jgi:hypothetical protein
MAATAPQMEVVGVSKEGKLCAKSQTEWPSGSCRNADTKSTGGDGRRECSIKTPAQIRLKIGMRIDDRCT